MIDEIIPDNTQPPINSQTEKLYKKEYKQGAELFQKALSSYIVSENPYQKAEFLKVMDKAMSVLNESAQALNQQALLKQNKKIESDYKNFSQSPDSPETLKKLTEDLNQAKQSTQ